MSKSVCFGWQQSRCRRLIWKHSKWHGRVQFIIKGQNFCRLIQIECLFRLKRWASISIKENQVCMRDLLKTTLRKHHFEDRKSRKKNIIYQDSNSGRLLYSNSQSRNPSQNGPTGRNKGIGLLPTIFWVSGSHFPK